MVKNQDIYFRKRDIVANTERNGVDIFHINF